MPISFLCPCRQPLQVPDIQAGKQVRCPACAQVLVVPTWGPPVAQPVPLVWRLPPQLPPPLPVGPLDSPLARPGQPGRKRWLVGLVAVLLLGGVAAFSLTFWILQSSRVSDTDDAEGRRTESNRPDRTGGRRTESNRPDRTGPDRPLPWPRPNPKPVRPTPPRSDAEPGDEKAPRDEQPVDALTARALARLNTFRQAAGLAPVTLDRHLSAGCRAHARYVARNIDHPSIRNWRLREEDPALPGYSAEGHQAARASFTDLPTRDPLRPLDEWMASLFFRLALLAPNLQRIGFGYAQHSRGWVCVLDESSGRGSSRVIVYPVAGQKDVPLAYPGTELPDPVPEATTKRAGYPLTVTFPHGAAVQAVKVKLKEGSGKEVPFWLSTPEKPAYKPDYQSNSVSVIAREPLRPRTTYTITVAAVVGGKPWRRTWSFTTAPTDTDPVAAAAKTVLEKVNAYRKIAGLAPVTLDPALTRGCTLHAQYLVKNADHPSAKGLGGHDEDPKLPGYTPEGKKAGNSAVIYSGPDPLSSVEGWMATFFHRIPLLDPDLKRIGFGHARGGTWGAVAVLDVFNGRGSDQPVFYPSDGQKEVPLAYQTGELPDPVPESKDKKAGYPVTVTFPQGTSVKNVSARLEASGTEVPLWLSTPEQTVHAGLQRNTVGLIARKPLRPDTPYTVTVTAEVGGKAWKRTWTFTTGKR